MPFSWSLYLWVSHCRKEQDLRLEVRTWRSSCGHLGAPLRTLSHLSGIGLGWVTVTCPALDWKRGSDLPVASEEGGRAGNGRFYPKGESLFLVLKESYFIMILAINSPRQTLSHFIPRNLLLSLLLSLAHLTLPTNVFSAPTPNAPESALFLFMGHELNGAWPQSPAKRVDQRNKRQLVVFGSVHVDLQNKLYP